MKMTASKYFAGLGVIFLLITAIFTFWFWEGENFSDRAVAGTYTLQLRGEKATLVLKPDHSFQQELDSAGTVKRAEGGWSVFGEGHIELSKEFLILPGQETSPSGAAYGVIVNRFGFVSIAMNPNGDGPRFHKNLFR
jgi:hypothetical protein